MTSIVASLAVVFIGAQLVKSAGETFRGRNTYTQCFTLIAYTIGPMLPVRMLDALPAMNPWITLCMGMVLSLSVLYHRFPRLLDPDPPQSQSFGLYRIGGVLLIISSGLARVLTELVSMQGKLTLFP
ncbi:YIP1 family protein [Pedosphaera parvula]